MLSVSCIRVDDGVETNSPCRGRQFPHPHMCNVVTCFSARAFVCYITVIAASSRTRVKLWNNSGTKQGRHPSRYEYKSSSQTFQFFHTYWEECKDVLSLDHHPPNNHAGHTRYVNEDFECRIRARINRVDRRSVGAFRHQPPPPDHSHALQTSTKAKQRPKLVDQHGCMSHVFNSGSEGVREGVGVVRPPSLDGDNLCLHVTA